MDHGCPKLLNVVNVKASLILILANTEAEKFRKGSPSSHIESQMNISSSQTFAGCSKSIKIHQFGKMLIVRERWARVWINKHC